MRIVECGGGGSEGEGDRGLGGLCAAGDHGGYGWGKGGDGGGADRGGWGWKGVRLRRWCHGIVGRGVHCLALLRRLLALLFYFSQDLLLFGAAADNGIDGGHFVKDGEASLVPGVFLFRGWFLAVRR